MAGVLWDDDGRAGVEASGVYRGVIKKNMIETVRDVHRPFLDVFIPGLFFEDADYPLTYVPMINMVLPLKVGQEVWVYFSQDDHRYPVLWKLYEDYKPDSGFVEEEFELPDNCEGVEFPEIVPTVEVVKFSDAMWFIGTESYGVLHWDKQCVLFSGDKIVLSAGSVAQFQLSNSNGLTASVGSGGSAPVFKVDAGGLKFSMGSGELSIGDGNASSKGSTVAPSSPGFLCALPVCLFTGATHTG